MRYKDIQKIDKGIRRHFHDDITVIVVYLDQHKKPSSGSRSKHNAAISCMSAPVDIFSLNTDEAEADLLSTYYINK